MQQSEACTLLAVLLLGILFLPQMRELLGLGPMLGPRPRGVRGPRAPAAPRDDATCDCEADEDPAACSARKADAVAARKAAPVAGQAAPRKKKPTPPAAKLEAQSDRKSDEVTADATMRGIRSAAGASGALRFADMEHSTYSRQLGAQSGMLPVALGFQSNGLKSTEAPSAKDLSSVAGMGAMPPFARP